MEDNRFYGAEVVGLAVLNLKAAIELASEALGPVIKMIGEKDKNGYDINDILIKMGEIFPAINSNARPAQPGPCPEPEPEPERETKPEPVPLGKKRLVTKYDKIYKYLDNVKPGKWIRLGPQPEGDPASILSAYRATMKNNNGVGAYQKYSGRYSVHCVRPKDRSLNYVDFIKIKLD
jgi:hypothetical protein